MKLNPILIKLYLQDKGENMTQIFMEEQSLNKDIIKFFKEEYKGKTSLSHINSYKKSLDFKTDQFWNNNRLI